MTLLSDPLVFVASSTGLSDAVPIVAIVFGCGFLIVKTITKAIVEYNVRKGDRNPSAGKGAAGPSDVSAIRQMQQTLTKMEERVEALETILIEHTRSQKL